MLGFHKDDVNSPKTIIWIPSFTILRSGPVCFPLCVYYWRHTFAVEFLVTCSKQDSALSSASLYPCNIGNPEEAWFYQTENASTYLKEERCVHGLRGKQGSMPTCQRVDRKWKSFQNNCKVWETKDWTVGREVDGRGLQEEQSLLVISSKRSLLLGSACLEAQKKG